MAYNERLDLTGKTFGRVEVLEFAHTNKLQKSCWLVRCECGTEKIVVGASLTNGHTKSCGCLHRERALEKVQLINISPELYKKVRANTYRVIGSRLYATKTGMFSRSKEQQLDDSRKGGITTFNKRVGMFAPKENN